MSITITVRSVGGFIAGVLTAFIVAWALPSLGAAAETDSGATFVAIEPCRLVDTRPDKGIGDRNDPIGPEEVHTVIATGQSGNCDLPADAVGLSLNVTATDATQNTNLRFYPSGTPVPVTSNLNPRPGAAPTPNAVTVGLSQEAKFDLRNAKGTVHVVIDVAGYYTDRLEMRVAELEALTSAMSLQTIDGHPTVRFSGVNVQVVDGSGKTRGANGTGNLIVGYQERNSEGDERSGSHNLVIGMHHSYDANATASIIAGRDNDVGAFGAFTVGRENTISSDYGVISGGLNNRVLDYFGSVSGGHGNLAYGYGASVSGGWHNVSAGDYSTVSGGYGIELSGGCGSWQGATYLWELPVSEC